MATNRYISNMRQVYIQDLIAAGDTDRAKELINSDIYSPILKPREVHPDAEPSPKDFNEMLTDIIYDTSIINVELCSLGYSFKELMEDTLNRLNSVKESLNKEKERQQDVNLLCNKYTMFSDIVNLTADDFTGNFSSEDGMITSKLNSQIFVDTEVVSIAGNGYEGNEYVYKNNAFLKESVDTSNRSNLTDNAISTIYEYSRITASNTEKEVFPLVNFDSIEAKCSITLASETKFNKLVIKSPQKDIVLSEVLISEDCTTFSPVFKGRIELNNTSKKYEDINYIPGSGIICFPDTYYVRITLESNSVTDDTIAFMKSVIV